MAKYNYFDDEVEFEKSDEHQKLSLNERVKAYITSSIEIDDNKRKKRITTLLLLFLVFVIFLVFVASFSHKINSQNKKDTQFNKDAGNVCINYISDYGVIKWESLDENKYGQNKARLTGLCYARQMDFNGDGEDELMLCYNDNNIYFLEVWGYDGGKFSQLYSNEANSTEDAKDGVWVSFYHKGGKYLICKSDKKSPEKVNLYELRGTKFKKQSKSIEYDCKKEMFTVNGDANTSDFEIIKLSVFRKSKGEVLVYQVTKNIDSFGNIMREALKTNKSDAQLKKEAYAEIINQRMEKYGEPKIKKENDLTYIDGLAVARLVDFDGDGNEELLLAYRKLKNKSKYDNYSGQNIYYEVPVYSMDVYSWNGSIAKRILSKDTTSNYLNDKDVFYVLLKNGEKTTHICSNTYTFENDYSYTASSKIYKLKNQKFETIYNAKLVNEYGYRRYYIDNQSVYSSTFEQKGYKVPMFMNDDKKPDKDKYTIIYMSGKGKDTYQSTIDKTEEVIKKLCPDYSSK